MIIYIIHDKTRKSKSLYKIMLPFFKPLSTCHFELTKVKMKLDTFYFLLDYFDTNSKFHSSREDIRNNKAVARFC